MVNPYTLNPTFTGFNKYLNFKVGFRDQMKQRNFSNYFETPRTSYISADKRLKSKKYEGIGIIQECESFHGVGGFWVSDKFEATSSTSLYASYSFNTQIIKPKRKGYMYGFDGRYKDEGLRMIIGTHVGFIRQSVNFNSLFDFLLEDNSMSIDSSIALRGIESKLIPDASFGVLFYSNYFYGV